MIDSVDDGSSRMPLLRGTYQTPLVSKSQSPTEGSLIVHGLLPANET
jgi:hypothetical protein